MLSRERDNESETSLPLSRRRAAAPQAREKRLNQLIVTADDFGLASEVNAAVEAAHKEGILSAASLMVAGPAADDAVERARRLPRLRVGLHLTLVEAPALLSRDEVPDLLGGDGVLRGDLARLGLDLALRPKVRRQVRAEIEAQFAAFRATGLPFDHVNAHKHFHLHPVVALEMLAIARRFGVVGVRVPLEPACVLGSVESGRTRSPAWIMAPWANWLARKVHREGFWAPAAVFGLAWSGAMTQARLVGLIDRLPSGCSEIYLHPATRGGFPFSTPDYGYTEEFAALVDPQALAAVRRNDIQLGGFRDFVAVRRPHG